MNKILLIETYNLDLNTIAFKKNVFITLNIPNYIECLSLVFFYFTSTES